MEDPWDGSKWHADECRMTTPLAEILAATAASLDVVQRRGAVQAFGVRRGLRCLRQAHRLRELWQIWVHAARATAPHADRVACARRLAGQVAAAATALRVAVVQRHYGFIFTPPFIFYMKLVQEAALIKIKGGV
jgi:hypothetical protein